MFAGLVFAFGCDEDSGDSRRPSAGPPCTSTCDGEGVADCEHPGVRTCGDYDGDGCFEWSEPTPCQRACVDGQCVECDNDCEPGNLSCGPTGGIRECSTNVDEDPCFEWAAEQACPEGQSCSGAQCRPSEDCINECGQVGVKQCALGENGYQECQTSAADDCLHWGAMVACEQGQSCSNGECRAVAECIDECPANARDCEAGGFRTCGDFDDDDCLEWSAVTPCEDAQFCSNGICDEDCQAECGPEGARQCSGAGFAVCGKHEEGNDCLIWGPVKACDGEETCSGGRCRAAGCINECGLDTKQCQGNGTQTCGNFDDDDCTEWGAVVPCDEGESCSNGECSTRCTNECGVLNQRQCAGNGYQVCGNTDEDACLEWGGENACPAGQVCANGECAAQCVNGCAEGSKQCQGAGVQTCGNFNEDACFEWSGVEPCPDGQTCSEGACAVACGDECVRGNVRCAPGGLQTCGNHDEDECADWGPAAPCPQGEFCSNAACAAVCNDECSAGAKRCADNGFETCGDYDNDDCDEWSAATPCPPGQLCSNGTCAAGCSDECASGTVQCAGNGFQSCGEHDGDACKDWSDVVACPDGQTCSNGICGRFCNDECEAGATSCGGGGVRTCGDFDPDSCREWGAGVACPAGQVCSNGGCTDQCENDCNDGDTRCRGGGIQTCGNYDGDACTDWSETAPCGAGEVCDNGACVVFDPGCAADGDCPEGFICAAGVCVEAGGGCQSNEDCAAGEFCDAVAGVCRPQGAEHRVGDVCGAEDCGADLECVEMYCTSICDPDTPCPVGSTCYQVDPNVPDAGLCLRDCADAAGCEEGQACYPAAGPLGGACWAVQCMADADCPSDGIAQMTCVDGQCVVQNGCDPLTGEGCGEGQVCLQYEGVGVCAELCVPFDDPCAGGMKCTPVGEVEGICVPAGASGAGAPCVDDSECDEATFCIDNGLGEGTCRLACDTWAEESPCPEGDICLSFGGRAGFCIEDCDNECDPGAERCNGNGLQQCGEAGDGDDCFEWAETVPCPAGMGCNEMWAVCDVECMADADCVAHPLVPVACVAGNCEVVGGCDPATGEGCQDFEICEPATPDGSKGVCVQMCDPLDGGCVGDNLRCGLFGGGSACVPVGMLGEREHCTTSVDCADGLACLTLANGDDRCLPLCDVWDNEPGCGDGACEDLGIDTRIGFCPPCEDACVAGETMCATEISIQACDYVVADGICTGWSEEELCPDGEACDMDNNVCRPWCNEDADCLVAVGGVYPSTCNAETGFCELAMCAPGMPDQCLGLDADGLCVPEDFDDEGNPIGEGACLYSCDPVLGNCEDGGTCDWYPLGGGDLGFVCLPAGGEAGPMEECAGTGSCMPGAGCTPLDDGEGGTLWMCLAYCTLGGDDCSADEECVDPEVFPAPVGLCFPAE